MIKCKKLWSKLGLVIIVRRVGQYVIRTIFVHIRAATINKQIAITINRFLDSTIRSTSILIVRPKIWKLFLREIFPKDASDKKCWILKNLSVWGDGRLKDDWGYWNVYLLDNFCKCALWSKAASSPGHSNLANWKWNQSPQSLSTDIAQLYQKLIL